MFSIFITLKWLAISFKPPFIDVIVATPALIDSNNTLPKGSFHTDGTTQIDDVSNSFIILSLGRNP